MFVFYRNMKEEDLNPGRVCDNGPGHHKVAAHLTHIHSMLYNSQNHSSSLQKELFYLNNRNCSLFVNIPLPYVGKEMPLSLSEPSGRNSSPAVPWKDSFCLCISSGEARLDGISHCVNLSVTGWLEEACSFAAEFSLCCPGDNFLCFAHVWLGKLQCNQELQFLELEVSSSIENELQLALLEELEFGGLTDLYSVPVASLNDYAMGLFNNQKSCIFLCYLNLVTSEQLLGCKKMLSNVQYVTTGFHVIQLVISVLAFALAGLWYAVVKIICWYGCTCTCQEPLCSDEEYGLEDSLPCCTSFGNHVFWEPLVHKTKACLVSSIHAELWKSLADGNREQGHDFVSHENLAVLIIQYLLKWFLF